MSAGDEATFSNADDVAASRESGLDGALLEQVSQRHLQYRRALERLQETLTHTMVTVQATTGAPMEFRPPSLGGTWHAVKEAEALLIASQQALSERRNML